MRTPTLRFLPLALASLALAACGQSGTESGKTGTTEAKKPATKGPASAKKAAEGLKVLRLPMRTDGPKSIDPVKGSTVYDSRAANLVYETLMEYEYTARPFKLRPLLLTEMPKPSADKLVWTFKLKKGVKFHDDACFPGGKGRELKSSDVFYSWKRMADKGNSPKSWWLMKKTIKGFDAYRDAQNAAAKFDYDAPVEGMKIVDDHTFEVTLTEPVYRFVWILAMFQLSVVPREAVEKYGSKFGRHPVGTGPFTMKENSCVTVKSMVF